VQRNHVIALLVVLIVISFSTLPAEATQSKQPAQAMQSSNSAGRWQPGDILKAEELWVNVTNGAGGKLSGTPLNNLIRNFTKQGWRPTYPITWDTYRGIYVLVFTRMAQYRSGVFIASLIGVYWDANSNCPRYSSNKRPFGGATCQQPALL
jgi:hypothetical protein